MTKLLYLTDSYKKETKAKVLEVLTRGNATFVILDQTVFYPEGGGQPSDRGVIQGKQGKLEVTHVRMHGDEVIHEGKLTGSLKVGETGTATIDWELRYDHMRWHSAGHIVHEVANQTIPGLKPIRGEHGKHAYIEYEGSINPKLKETIQKQVNMLVAGGKTLKTELVSFNELKERVSWVPERLPKNKPLRILTVEGFSSIPDGGTQVANTEELADINIEEIEQLGELVRVHYSVSVLPKQTEKPPAKVKSQNVSESDLTLDTFRALILEMQSEIRNKAQETDTKDLESLKLAYFGTNGRATSLIKRLRELPPKERRSAGLLINEFKTAAMAHFEKDTLSTTKEKWFDATLPGVRPSVGHLHIVTQAISEITRIFERISFTRVRHPEVDWDYYAFESLNMPKNHPARDEWETFFIDYPGRHGRDPHKQKIVLTPHTSNGQVREMEKGNLPIRMINIAKCYRRQSDVSHVPMFHQFEGLYVDRNVSIGHLSGVMDYFFKEYYGPERKSRLRPFHFQFTEPSFEVDINCGICLGKGCKFCKEGWLELGGSGMVHPNVLRAGGIDPDIYSGFAFGWGVERVAMMKSGTQLDDIRELYSNDIRFLEQF